jgi:hypothetical protein
MVGGVVDLAVGQRVGDLAAGQRALRVLDRFRTMGVAAMLFCGNAVEHIVLVARVHGRNHAAEVILVHQTEVQHGGCLNLRPQIPVQHSGRHVQGERPPKKEVGRGAGGGGERDQRRRVMEWDALKLVASIQRCSGRERESTTAHTVQPREGDTPGRRCCPSSPPI